jgi:hypothetical protein
MRAIDCKLNVDIAAISLADVCTEISTILTPAKEMAAVSTFISARSAELCFATLKQGSNQLCNIILVVSKCIATSFKEYTLFKFHEAFTSCMYSNKRGQRRNDMFESS